MALSREQMVERLNQGMSVLVRVGGKKDGPKVQVTKVEDLPSEAEMAIGDPKAMAQAKANLIKQRAELDAQMALLEGDEAVAAASPTTKKRGKKGDKAADATDPNAGNGEGTGDDENENDDETDPNAGNGEGNGEPPAIV